jgi:hypothetical protein
LTIFELLDNNRRRYFDALRDADAAWDNGGVDVGRMESLLAELLKQQITPLPSMMVRPSPRRPTPGRVIMPKLPRPDDPDKK